MPVNSFENYYMSWKPILKRGGKPLYTELAEQMEEDIRAGILSPGTKLPPQRELADYLDINLSTVTRAFKICSKKGLITAATGNGTYVSSDVIYDNNMLILNSAEDKIIEMGAILPNIALNKPVTEAIRKILAEGHEEYLMQYGEINGTRWQKTMGMQWLQKTGVTVDDPSQILIASGGQNAILAVLAGNFVSGDRVGCDEITYPGLKSAAKMLGIILVPIAKYTRESITAAVKNNNIKALYVIPDYHNPTTRVLPLETRQLIAEQAKEHGLLIMEDSINSLLGTHHLPQLKQLAPENTIYISSLSKTVSPGLRIAYVAVPLKWKKDTSVALYNCNIVISPLMLQAASNLISTGEADRIVEARRGQTRQRNQLVNEYLGNYQMEGDEDGPFRWLTLPAQFDAHVFEIAARTAGVQVYASDRFMVGKEVCENAIRISVVSEQNDIYFVRGLQILARMLKEERPEECAFL